MMDRPGITEQDLHAYADGELDAAAQAEVATWLETHPDDAQFVRELEGQRRKLHADFDAVLEEPVPPRIKAALAGRTHSGRGLSWWPRAAAAVVLFAAGLGAGWLLWGSPVAEPDFVQMAFSAHVVHAAEKRHAVEVQAKEERHLVAWLSKRLAYPIKAPSLAAQGYRLVGGRLIADAGSPAAQFMYENAAGQRITVYSRRTQDTDHTAFQFMSADGVSAFYWIEAPLAFALVGNLPRQALMPLAEKVYKDFGH